MLLAELYTQNLDPLGNRFASTFVAALPVLVLFYLLVKKRWLASWAGAAGSVVAIALAVLVFKMPADKAILSFVNGAAFGLLFGPFAPFTVPFFAVVGGIGGGFAGAKLAEMATSGFYGRLDEVQKQQVKASIYRQYGVNL